MVHEDRTCLVRREIAVTHHLLAHVGDRRLDYACVSLPHRVRVVPESTNIVGHLETGRFESLV